MWAIIGNIVGWVWNGIQAASDAIVVALKFGYHILRAGVTSVWDAAHFTWSNVIKPVGEWLDRAYRRLRAVYDKVFAPIHKWLTRIADVTRKIYTLFVRPILSTIDSVRRVLKLLELLHVAWAQKLDDELAALERKIALPVQRVIEVVNYLDSRISAFVLTADNLFQRVTMLKTVGRDLNPILNMQAVRMLATLTRKQRDGPAGAASLAPVDEHAQYFDDIASGNADATGIDFTGAEELWDSFLAEP